MQRRYSSEQRSQINRCLSKAMAYKECGKAADAEFWAARLLAALELADIIGPAHLRTAASIVAG